MSKPINQLRNATYRISVEVIENSRHPPVPIVLACKDAWGPTIAIEIAAVAWGKAALKNRQETVFDGERLCDGALHEDHDGEDDHKGARAEQFPATTLEN